MQAHIQTPTNWHKYQAATSKQNKPKGTSILRWNCPLRQTFVGEFLLVPINSMKMLTKEETVLDNNCSSNLFRCYNETYTAISLRTRSGERLATIFLQKVENYWQLDSCLGRDGANVLEETLTYMDEELNVHEETTPTELYYICQETLRLLNNKQNSH